MATNNDHHIPEAVLSGGTKILFGEDNTANNNSAVGSTIELQTTPKSALNKIPFLKYNNTNDYVSARRKAHLEFAMNTLQSKLAKNSPLNSVSELIAFTRENQYSSFPEHNNTIAGLRGILTNKQEILIAHDGTIENESDIISMESFSCDKPEKLYTNLLYFPDLYKSNNSDNDSEQLNHTEFYNKLNTNFYNCNTDDQWYIRNESAEREIKRMFKTFSDAQPGFLDNGLMYWIIRINPIVCGIRKSWTILAVYNHDYSSSKRNCRFYVVKPNFEEICQLVNICRGEKIEDPRRLHLFPDPSNGQYLICCDYEDKDKEQHSCVSTSLLCVIYWINLFELSLIDYEAWVRLQQKNPLF